MSVILPTRHGPGPTSLFPIRSLFARLVLVVLVALLLAQGLVLAWAVAERRQLARQVMHAVISPDVAGAVTLLERLTPEERVAWLARLARPGYRYLAGALPAGRADTSSSDTRWVENSLVALLGAARVGPVIPPARANPADPFHIGLMLADGTPYTLELDRELVLSGRPGVFHLSVQLVLLAGLACGAMWWVMRPLERLVRSAGEFDPKRVGACWPGGGTRETARIAHAFNRMGAHTAWQCGERRRLFATVSRELDRSFMRIRLRVALLEADAVRQSLLVDLAEAEACMGVGMAFVHAVGGEPAEPMQPTDLYALLHALACDHIDEGRAVRLVDRHPLVLVTRPALLRQVLTYLIDGSLGFTGGVELRTCLDAADGSISISVLDRGPDVTEAEFESGQPLCRRVESAVGPSERGTRLGLLVVRRLATALGARLNLRNRPGGGLEAELVFKGPRLPVPKGSRVSDPFDMRGDRWEGGEANAAQSRGTALTPPP